MIGRRRRPSCAGAEGGLRGGDRRRARAPGIWAEPPRRRLAGVAGFGRDRRLFETARPGRPKACRETPAGFPRGFANARARTCWLSALAQALWHDPGFRAAFDAALATTEDAREPPPPRSPAAKVDALRRCWAAFHQNEGILKADALAEAFGDVADPASGYGDAAEAYCALRSALDQSDAESLRAVGNGLRYAPLMPSERAPREPRASSAGLRSGRRHARGL